MRKITLLIILCTTLLTISANDLTKVGVVNVNTVYTRFFKESADSRKFDEYKISIQEEISKRKIEIDQIDKELIIARDDDNEDLVAELESDLYIKKVNLQEYSRHKNQELNARISSDATKKDFTIILLEAIEKVGLQHGYSVFYNSNDPNIIWYAPGVDVTDLVIESLMK